MQDSTLIFRMLAAGGRLKDGTDSEFKIVEISPPHKS